MSGANAINWGYNPSLANDQYWQNYWQYSQNLSNQYAANATTTNNTATTNTQTTNANNPAFKGTKKTNESHFWRNTAIVAAGAAAIIGGVALKKGCGTKTIKEVFQNKEVWSTIKTGLSEIKNSIKGSANVLNNKFTANINGSNVYYTGLGKNQVLEGAVLKDGTTLKALDIVDGFSSTELKLENIINGKFKIGDNFVTIKDGKIASYLDKDGKVLTEGIDTIKDTFTNFLKNIKGSGATIESAEIKDIATEGVERIFKCNGTTWDLTKVTTDRFASNSDAIAAIINSNPTGTLAKQINAGSDTAKLIEAGLKPNIIERTIQDEAGNNRTVQFVGNTITGIYDDAHKLWAPGTDFYEARMGAQGSTQRTSLASWLELIKGNKLDDFKILNWC